MTPRRFAELFITRFATKKVGGGKMLKYLEERFERWGQMQYKKAVKDRRAKEKTRKEEAFLRGQEIGYNKALREITFFNKGKLKEAYSKGYKDGYNRSPGGITKRDVYTAFGIDENTFYQRMKRWKDLKRTLTEPVQTKYRSFK